MRDPKTRQAVRERARDRCEYCGVRQEDLPLVAFHIEHIVPKQHGGSDALENLALACHHCNCHKGPNLTGIDPETTHITPLFHPRRDVWRHHFSFRGASIVGLTAVGRTSVRVLAMNSPGRLELRAELGLAWPGPVSRAQAR